MYIDGQYPEMLHFIEKNQIPIQQLIGKTRSLSEVPNALMHFETYKEAGIQLMTQ